jgi:DNA-binding GntR family transcriptional regulator
MGSNVFETIDTKTLREHTYKVIKDLILRNLLLPGHDIPIKKLATDLGISETPVREALVILKAEGFIEYEPHKKPQVADITEEEIRQVYEVRKLLEPYAAGVVVKVISISPELKNKLQEVQKLAEKVLHSDVDAFKYDEYLEIDLKLHEIFLQAIENKIFREVLTLVGSRSMRIRTFVEATPKAHLNTMIHQITEEHQAIIEAMLREDSNDARKRVHDHLLNAESRTLQEMESYKEKARPLEALRALTGK